MIEQYNYKAALEIQAFYDKEDADIRKKREAKDRKKAKELARSLEPKRKGVTSRKKATTSIPQIVAQSPPKPVNFKRRINKRELRTQMMAYLKYKGATGFAKLNFDNMKALYDKVYAESQRDPFLKDQGIRDHEVLQNISSQLVQGIKSTEEDLEPEIVKKMKLNDDEVKHFMREVEFSDVIESSNELSQQNTRIVLFAEVKTQEGLRLYFKRENGYARVFDSLWDIIHLLSRTDLDDLHKLVNDLYSSSQVPTVQGFVLSGDLNIMFNPSEYSQDFLWQKQEEWSITRWRFFERSGVHTLELSNNTMIHMFAERLYPLTTRVMDLMLNHGVQHIAAEYDICAEFVRWFYCKMVYKN